LVLLYLIVDAVYKTLFLSCDKCVLQLSNRRRIKTRTAVSTEEIIIFLVEIVAKVRVRVCVS
jgi:hypothetical protein